MKRIQILLLATLTLAGALAIGCGGGGQTGTAPPPPAAPAATTAATPAETPAAGGAAMGSASITGSIRFSGTAPQAAKINMAADAVCQKNHPEPAFSEEVVVNSNGTLRNVFVYVTGGLEGKSYPAPTEPVILDQKGCRYEPHVWGVQAGQPIKILNNDGTLHNVHALPKTNKGFNIAMPRHVKEKVQTFDQPEVMIRFQCEVHSWMNAYCGVVSHPFFAVTGDGGSFTIQNLPAGTYEITAWHEKYGTQSQSVTVGDGESQTADFEFKAS